ncbi:phosphotransferase enzyme family protein [Planococcus shixiaomingii]|uniref:phosphotransferase enzyme family protein n=1 Tax=Planococcus shixiaomingii TaxID=3058393 RepID=UPI002622646A|nr:phosphotransferase [Planococcus sp. N022]WKA56550.1 phosphotransferase [Planococcus sp. N022]
MINNVEKFADVAKLAADRYDIQLNEICFLAEETNILYKLSDTNGNKFLMKIFQNNSSNLEDNQLEVYMMNLVIQRGCISLPSILSATDGSEIQEIFLGEDRPPIRVAVYSWLEGEDLDSNETEERFIHLGEMTARLHAATFGEKVPKTFSPKRWDNVFYYIEDKMVYKQSEYQRYLSREYHELMDAIIPYLNSRLSGYYQINEGNLQLIHSDLNPWNVLVSEDAMHIIDFEDTMLGLPLHDIAILLYYYRYEEVFDYENVKDLFFKGYEKIRPLPEFEEFDLELLMTARRVNFLNYILLVSDDPSSFIDKSLPKVREFVRKYNLKI